MTHVANQRIKKDGTSYLPGDPIELTSGELAELPEGAVSPMAETVADVTPKPAQTGQTPDETAGKPAGDDAAGGPAGDQAERLAAAIAALTDADFRKDGIIRAESLRQLIETLGFEVTAEAVAEVTNTAPGDGEQD